MYACFSHEPNRINHALMIGRFHRKPITLCTWVSVMRHNIEEADTLAERPTISKVQTLLIQTLSFPSTPSTLSSSTPSHQHLRAGFLQNNRSFCAMPTALLLANSLPLMSVLRRARAKLHITALLGSPARCPQRSSLWNPLQKG